MKPLRPEASCAEMFVVPSLHKWRRVELGLMRARVASLWEDSYVHDVLKRARARSWFCGGRVI